MIRMQAHNVLDRGIPPGVEVWMDHVLFDIPSTVAAAIRNAQDGIVAMTIHEIIARGLESNYASVLEAARERGMRLYVAVTPSFERIPLQDWRRRYEANRHHW